MRIWSDESSHESDSTATWTPKSHRINLTQKRKAETRQWQFYPVQWNGNKPDPRLILIDGEPDSWKVGDAFFLNWREGGKRTRKKVGKFPREALDAWREATGASNGSIPDDEGEATDGSTHTPVTSIEAGIKLYLAAVKGTKGIGAPPSASLGCGQPLIRHGERHQSFVL